MGSPKALLDWFGVALVNDQIANLRRAGVNQICVVLGHERERVGAEIADGAADVVFNPDYERGKLTSLKAGVAAAARECEALMILAVDQPRPVAVFTKLIQAHRERAQDKKDKKITIPYYGGRGGHPVIISAAARGDLMELDDEREGLRGLIADNQNSVQRVPFDSGLIHLDINAAADYANGKSEYAEWLRQNRE